MAMITQPNLRMMSFKVQEILTLSENVILLPMFVGQSTYNNKHCQFEGKTNRRNESSHNRNSHKTESDSRFSYMCDRIISWLLRFEISLFHTPVLVNANVTNVTYKIVVLAWLSHTLWCKYFYFSISVSLCLEKPPPIYDLSGYEIALSRLPRGREYTHCLEYLVSHVGYMPSVIKSQISIHNSTSAVIYEPEITYSSCNVYGRNYLVNLTTGDRYPDFVDRFVFNNQVLDLNLSNLSCKHYTCLLKQCIYLKGINLEMKYVRNICYNTCLG